MSSGLKFKNDVNAELHSNYVEVLKSLAPWSTEKSVDANAYIEAGKGKFRSKIINTNEIPPEYAKLIDTYRSMKDRNLIQ